jgi:flagellar basal-body rod protein FlgB
MIGKLDDYLRSNESALSLRAQRQQVLASNIANADTPNYKARDIDFAAAMQTANSKVGTGGMTTTTANQIAQPNDGSTLPGGTPLLYRQPAQGTADGNTVDMDVERAAFADNGVRYEAGISMINQQIRNMMAAIQGGT